jgi:dTMP kinase
MHTRENINSEGGIVAFEGIDRAGKSSILNLLTQELNDCKIPIISCGELQSPVANLLADQNLAQLTPFQKTFLFAADRAWTYENVCLPALESGKLVLWDRYVDSALAYRAAELKRRPSIIDIEFVRDINKPFMRPRVTILIDITAATSSQRPNPEGEAAPYAPSFLAAVRSEYLLLASTRSDYVIIDGDAPIDVLSKRVAAQLRLSLEDLF